DVGGEHRLVQCHRTCLRPRTPAGDDHLQLRPDHAADSTVLCQQHRHQRCGGLSHGVLMNRTLRASQRGQAIVLIALMIVVMFGLVGLAIDSGRAYLDRRHLQAAVDAAALAAAYNYMNTTDYAQAEQTAVDTYSADELLYGAASCAGLGAMAVTCTFSGDSSNQLITVNGVASGTVNGNAIDICPAMPPSPMPNFTVTGTQANGWTMLDPGYPQPSLNPASQSWASTSGSVEQPGTYASDPRLGGGAG